MPDAIGTIHTITDLSNNKYNIHGVLYAECDTSASVATKAVTIPGITALTEGLSIRVHFANGQGEHGTNIALNLNNLGAKTIVCRHYSTSGGGTAAYIANKSWVSGQTVDFVYNNNYWVILAGNNLINGTESATDDRSGESGIAVAPRVINRLALNMISGAAVYDSTSTYSVGDRARYEYNTWECTTNIATPEEWNATHWQALDPLQTQIDNMGGGGVVCIEGETTTLSVGTTTVSLSGLTSSHIVCDWGFSVGDSNNPPADVEVTTSAGSYTITVSTVYSAGATMTPVFLLKQNTVAGAFGVELGDLIKVVTLRAIDNVSVAAGANQGGDIDLTSDAAKAKIGEGWTPVCICGWGTNMRYSVLYNCTFSRNTMMAYITMYNPHTSAHNVQLDVNFLCIKTGT